METDLCILHINLLKAPSLWVGSVSASRWFIWPWLRRVWTLSGPFGRVFILLYDLQTDGSPLCVSEREELWAGQRSHVSQTQCPYCSLINRVCVCLCVYILYWPFDEMDSWIFSFNKPFLFYSIIGHTLMWDTVQWDVLVILARPALSLSRGSEVNPTSGDDVNI